MGVKLIRFGAPWKLSQEAHQIPKIRLVYSAEFRRQMVERFGSRPSCVDGPFAAREFDVDDDWSGASMCPACLRGT